MRSAAPILLAALLLGAGPAPAEEPALPPGLEPADEPALPPGLAPADEPIPPRGPAAAPPPPPPAPVIRLAGFVEGRGGRRLDNDADTGDASLAELRLRLEADRHASGVALRLAADLIHDAIADSHAVDLETGEGALDLREAHARFSPASFLDVKAGRQILTWGTGDLLFINDLFPKDWNAFLLGRDEQYLKAPSDALKLSGFSDWANLDLVYTPRFDADRFVDGRRVSFFHPALGRIVGRDAVLRADRPNRWFADDEWAARLYRGFGAYEAALYAYDGFWKSPAGLDAASGRFTFPRLTVVGASLRGPAAGGIAGGEIGYYRSRRDPDGDDPNIPNSELRALLGYERELARDLTLGLQYYLEHMRGHAAYRRALPAGAVARDRDRHVVTARLRWLTRNQNLVWSLFAFASPSDSDAYLRPGLSYKATDDVTVELGANIFAGKRRDTFFGQFRENGNAFLALRYGF